MKHTAAPQHNNTGRVPSCLTMLQTHKTVNSHDPTKFDTAGQGIPLYQGPILKFGRMTSGDMGETNETSEHIETSDTYKKSLEY